MRRGEHGARTIGCSREWPEYDAIVRAVPMTAVTEPEDVP